LVYSSSEIKQNSNDEHKCHDKSAKSLALRPVHRESEATHMHAQCCHSVVTEKH